MQVFLSVCRSVLTLILVLSRRKGNCSAGNAGAHLSAWVFHLIAMVYDLVALSISTLFLFKMNMRDKRFSRLPKMWVAVVCILALCPHYISSVCSTMA